MSHHTKSFQWASLGVWLCVGGATSDVKTKVLLLLLRGFYDRSRYKLQLPVFCGADLSSKTSAGRRCSRIEKRENGSGQRGREKRKKLLRTQVCGTRAQRRRQKRDIIACPNTVTALSRSDATMITTTPVIKCVPSAFINAC